MGCTAQVWKNEGIQRRWKKHRKPTLAFKAVSPFLVFLGSSIYLTRGS
jgi:hypothetical protein